MTTRAKVTIVGGDPAIGGALEVLLQAAGYRAWFLPEFEVDSLGELLGDTEILIFTPTLSIGRRKALLDVMRNPATLVKIPILELLPTNGGEQHLQEKHKVLWPCSMRELKRAIDDTLLDRE
jgi:hypothetical protein